MSHGGELLALRENPASQPSFELALRGYDRRQVDRYVSQADSDITTLAAEREQAFGQIQGLATQVQQLQAELTELRQRPAQVDRASFRHLGPMVEQILALAEQQAEAITNTAAQLMADHQTKAEKILVEARDQAAQVSRDFEVALATRRTDEEKADEQRRAAADRELTEHRAAAEREVARQRAVANQQSAALRAEAQQYAADVRRRADEQNTAHQQQLTAVQQDIQTRRQALAEAQAELDAAQQRLVQSRQEAATADHEVAQLQQRLGDLRQELTAELNRLDEARSAAESAERHAKEVRARVQREAKRVADLAAAAVMAAAVGGADTGEFPLVMVDRSGAGQTAPDEAAEPSAGKELPAGKVTQRRPQPGKGPVFVSAAETGSTVDS